jgi:PAS domain S-box-containing protein
MEVRKTIIKSQYNPGEQRLSEGEENYHRVIEYAREGIAIQVAGTIVYVNHKLLEMLGYQDATQLIGQAAAELTEPARREISIELETSMLIESTELFSIEDVYLCQDGTFLPVEVSVIPISYQGAPAVQIIARDISERKKVEAEIWEYQDMLKRLSSDLILSEEAQRRNLAIVLHDHLGQSLAMAKIKMDGILGNIQDENLKSKLQAIHQDISNAVKQTRSLTYELSPPVLHELGLIVALEWRLEKFSEETKMQTSINKNVDHVDLRNEQSVILFRSVDEILKNIIKHAEASAVNILVLITKYALTVEVEDNGKGFDTSLLGPQRRNTGSFGLFSIKERIEYLGGVLEITSKIGRGTIVTLNVPVSLEGEQWP